MDLSRLAKISSLCSCTLLVFLEVRNDLISPLMILYTLKMQTLFRVKVAKRKWYSMCITTAGGIYLLFNLLFLG